MYSFVRKKENYAQSAKELIAGSFSRKIPQTPNNEDFSKFSWIFFKSKFQVQTHSEENKSTFS